jgi:hypothetical protein
LATTPSASDFHTSSGSSTPVFHVSQIEPSVPNRFPDRQPPPPELIEIDGELKYELCEILDSKYNLCCWSTCELFYYVQWMGYEGTNEESQWTAATNLTHAHKLIEEFHKRYPTKPSPDIFAPDHETRTARRQSTAKRRKALRAQE